MSTLTDEQRMKMEENRRQALLRRAARTQAPQPQPKPVQLPSSPFPKPSNLSSVIHPPKDKHKTVPVPLSVHANRSNPSSATRPQTDKPKWNVMTDTIKGTVSFISKDRFTLEIPYNSKCIELCKSIPGRQYDPETKNWNFPLDQYDHFKDVMAPLAPNVTIGSLPKNILKIFSAKSDPVNYESIDLSSISPELVNSLFPFQKLGVQFAISKKGRCLIADEMGLGKTLQALAVADYYSHEWPLLIICPSSMRFQWFEEITRFLDVPTFSILVVTSSKTYIEGVKVVIISYDLVGKLVDALKKFGFGMIICDESHCVKNIKTVRAKSVIELSKKVKRVLLLTGTPALSRPIELFAQIKIVHPTLFPQLTEYGVRYCEGKTDKFGWNFQGSSHLSELRVVLEEQIMIRRIKANVLDQLPSKIRQVVHLNKDLIEGQNHKMSSLEKKLNREHIKGSEKRSTLLAYYSETGKVKTAAICDYIDGLLDKNHKFLCFAHHKSVMDAICDKLESRQVYYIRIDGSVNSEERKSVCDQFQEDDKFRVAVLSVTAANTGLTLTAAQIVVFAELYWNPGELQQAEDRAHRIGQKGSVLVQYLLAKGTSDDYVWPLVQKKLGVLNKAGLSLEKNMNAQGPQRDSEKGLVQTNIAQFFSELEVEDIDESDLIDLMDQIEGIPEKKQKLN